MIRLAKTSNKSTSFLLLLLLFLLPLFFGFNTEVLLYPTFFFTSQVSRKVEVIKSTFVWQRDGDRIILEIVSQPVLERLLLQLVC
ncbi:hypothetical protein V8F33_007863 [Rhypophila sp. PSN 637]